MTASRELTQLASATLFGSVFVAVNYVIQSLEDAALALTALSLTGGLALVLCVIAAIKIIEAQHDL